MRNLKSAVLILTAVILAGLMAGCASAPYDYREVVVFVPVPEPHPRPLPRPLPGPVTPLPSPDQTVSSGTRDRPLDRNPDAAETVTRDRGTAPATTPTRTKPVRGEQNQGRNAGTTGTAERTDTAGRTRTR